MANLSVAQLQAQLAALQAENAKLNARNTVGAGRVHTSEKGYVCLFMGKGMAGGAYASHLPEQWAVILDAENVAKIRQECDASSALKLVS